MKIDSLRFKIFKIRFTYYFFRDFNRRKLRRIFKKINNGIYITWIVISLYLFLVDRELFYDFTSAYKITLFYVLVNIISYIVRHLIKLILFLEYLNTNNYKRINKDFIASVNINAISLRKRELITIGEYVSIVDNMLWWRV
ncbi:hypothetical protein [uncultured Clostridium sp.]|uniref:hypothetical protein n=1 Tax=uncultured Clostridium sp. TaxID=59620 RepID=UPI0026F39BEE|nr:hypothetical protein [uncultured Clostridium sp.]